MTTHAVEIPGYVAGTWTIDTAHSDVAFSVRHLMVAKVRGHFTRFSGTIVTAEDPLASYVTARIDVASVDTGQPGRDDHLRTADFLDVEAYPEMTYESTGLRADGDAYVLDGRLGLHGVTREVPLRLELNGFVPDVFRENEPGAMRMGLTATGELDRTDFGITYNAPIPGASGVALAEKVQLTLEVEAALEP